MMPAALFWFLLAGNFVAGIWFACVVFSAPVAQLFAGVANVVSAAWAVACWRRYTAAAPAERVKLGRWMVDDGAAVWTVYSLPPLAMTLGRWREWPNDRRFYVGAEWPRVGLRVGCRSIVIGPSV